MELRGSCCCLEKILWGFPATRCCLARQRVCHDREHRRGIGLHVTPQQRGDGLPSSSGRHIHQRTILPVRGPRTFERVPSPAGRMLNAGEFLCLPQAASGAWCAMIPPGGGARSLKLYR